MKNKNMISTVNTETLDNLSNSTQNNVLENINSNVQFPGTPYVLGGDVLPLGEIGERRISTLMLNNQNSLANAIDLTQPILDANNVANFANSMANSIVSVSNENVRGQTNREIILNFVRQETEDPLIVSLSNESLLNATNALENGIRAWSSSTVANMNNFRNLLSRRNDPSYSYANYLRNVGRPVDEVTDQIVTEYGLYEFFFMLDESSRREIIFFFRV